jgi:hypothetical protein
MQICPSLIIRNLTPLSIGFEGPASHLNADMSFIIIRNLTPLIMKDISAFKWEAGPSKPIDNGVKVLIIKEGHICIQVGSWSFRTN